MSTLTFTKQQAGIYWADDDTKRYWIINVRGRARHPWRLEIRDLAVTAGVVHTLGTQTRDTDQANTLRECRAIAQAYHDVGDDYAAHEHGYRSRLTEAICRAYDRL